MPQDQADRGGGGGGGGVDASFSSPSPSDGGSGDVEAAAPGAGVGGSPSPMGGGGDRAAPGGQLLLSSKFKVPKLGGSLKVPNSTFCSAFQKHFRKCF